MADLSLTFDSLIRIIRFTGTHWEVTSALETITRTMIRDDPIHGNSINQSNISFQSISLIPNISPLQTVFIMSACVYNFKDGALHDIACIHISRDNFYHIWYI